MDNERVLPTVMSGHVMSGPGKKMFCAWSFWLEHYQIQVTAESMHKIYYSPIKPSKLLCHTSFLFVIYFFWKLSSVMSRRFETTPFYIDKYEIITQNDKKETPCNTITAAHTISKVPAKTRSKDARSNLFQPRTKKKIEPQLRIPRPPTLYSIHGGRF